MGKVYHNLLTEREMIGYLYDLVSEMPNRSQREVADLLGMSESSLSQILHGKKHLTDEHVRKIKFVKKTMYQRT